MKPTTKEEQSFFEREGMAQRSAYYGLMSSKILKFQCAHCKEEGISPVGEGGGKRAGEGTSLLAA